MIDLSKPLSMTEAKPRKVFGANDYIERQEKMKNTADNSSAVMNSGEADEGFTDFHVKLGSQIGSVNKLY